MPDTTRHSLRTVADLRRLLAGLPDDIPVLIFDPEPNPELNDILISADLVYMPPVPGHTGCVCLEPAAPAEPLPTVWIAGWNTPSFLPEMEPAAFDDWESAAAYLISELGTEIDLALERGEDVTVERLRNESADLVMRDGEEWSVQIAGTAYWLERQK